MTNSLIFQSSTFYFSLSIHHPFSFNFLYCFSPYERDKRGSRHNEKRFNSTNVNKIIKERNKRESRQIKSYSTPRILTIWLPKIAKEIRNKGKAIQFQEYKQNDCRKKQKTIETNEKRFYTKNINEMITERNKRRSGHNWKAIQLHKCKQNDQGKILKRIGINKKRFSTKNINEMITFVTTCRHCYY